MLYTYISKSKQTMRIFKNTSHIARNLPHQMIFYMYIWHMEWSCFSFKYLSIWLYVPCKQTHLFKVGCSGGGYGWSSHGFPQFSQILKLLSWWVNQPIKTYASNLDHLPTNRGANRTSLKPPPRIFENSSRHIHLEKCGKNFYGVNKATRRDQNAHLQQLHMLAV